MYIENIITKLRGDAGKFEPHISDFDPIRYRTFLIRTAEIIAEVTKDSVLKVVTQRIDGTFINAQLNGAAIESNNRFLQNRTFGQDDYGCLIMLRLGTFYRCDKRRTFNMFKGVDDFGNTFSEKHFTCLNY